MEKAAISEEKPFKSLNDIENEQWVASPEFVKYRKWRALMIVLALLGVALTIATVLVNAAQSRRESESGLDDLTGWLAFTAYVVSLVLYVRYASSGREKAIERFRYSLLRPTGLGVITSPEEQNSPTLTELQQRDEDNQNRIAVYHQIATSQSKQAFLVSQIAMGLGLILVVTLGVAASRAETTTGAIVSGIVAAVSAATSGYIGATFLRAQADAATQLREFFLQPVEIGRILTAERLLDHLDDADQKSETVRYIIRSTMMSTREDVGRATKPSSQSPASPA